LYDSDVREVWGEWQIRVGPGAGQLLDYEGPDGDGRLVIRT